MTWKDAPTKFVDVGGTKFAYRELGPSSTISPRKWTDGIRASSTALPPSAA